MKSKYVVNVISRINGKSSYVVEMPLSAFFTITGYQRNKKAYLIETMREKKSNPHPVRNYLLSGVAIAAAFNTDFLDVGLMLKFSREMSNIITLFLIILYRFLLFIYCVRNEKKIMSSCTYDINKPVTLGYLPNTFKKIVVMLLAYVGAASMIYFSVFMLEFGIYFRGIIAILTFTFLASIFSLGGFIFNREEIHK